MRKILWFLPILAAFALLSPGGALTHAQYPSPVGGATLSASDTSPVVGSNTTLTCEVRDVAGAPIAGAACVFTIVSEPGGPNGDAAVGSKTVTRTTNASGIATTNLYVGSVPGSLVVEVKAGDLVSNVVVSVQGGAGLPPAAPIGIQPPNTGDGRHLRGR